MTRIVPSASLSMNRVFPLIDLDAWAKSEGAVLSEGLFSLLRFYLEIDEHNRCNTRELALPCGAGCAGCCHESVFLSPLEFALVWEFVQSHCQKPVLSFLVERGLALYAEHRLAIAALLEPTPEGTADHWEIAKNLRFRCPFLSEEDRCLVYPVRELYARLFGQSFNQDGGIYGCDLSGKSVANKTVTLLSAPKVAARLAEFPLVTLRQVYPYYFHYFYGDDGQGRCYQLST